LPIFAIFWTSAFSVVASWQQSDKDEHGCTTTNLPLPNGIKIAQTLTFKSVTDKQTDKTNSQTNRQTKNSTFLATSAAGEMRAPTKLGMVIEDLGHVLSPRKRFVV